MTGRAIGADTFVRLICRYGFLIVTIKTEAARFGLQKKAILGVVRIVTSQTAPGSERAVDVLLVHLEVMTVEAKLFLGSNKIVEEVAIVAGIAVPGRIRTMFGKGGLCRSDGGLPAGSVQRNRLLLMLRVRNSIEEEAQGLVVATKSQHEPAESRHDPRSSLIQKPPLSLRKRPLLIVVPKVWVASQALSFFSLRSILTILHLSDIASPSDDQRPAR